MTSLFAFLASIIEVIACFYWLWLSARTAQGASEVITSSKEKALSFGWGLSSGLITIPAYTAPPR